MRDRRYCWLASGETSDASSASDHRAMRYVCAARAGGSRRYRATPTLRGGRDSGRMYVGIMRSRLVRIGASAAVGIVGLIGYQAATQVASAAPPPVITTDFAAYPPARCRRRVAADGRRRPRRAIARSSTRPTWPGPHRRRPGGVRRSRPERLRREPLACVGSRTWSSARRHGHRPVGTVDARLREPPDLLPAEGHERPDVRHHDDQVLVRSSRTDRQRRSSSAIAAPDRRVRLPPRRRRLPAAADTVPPAAASCAATSSTSSSAARCETVGPHGSYYSTTIRAAGRRPWASARSTRPGRTC